MGKSPGRPKFINLPAPWNRYYSRAKALAKFRNEFWAFTPETWYDMWVESGVMQYRSNRPEAQ